MNANECVNISSQQRKKKFSPGFDNYEEDFKFSLFY